LCHYLSPVTDATDITHLASAIRCGDRVALGRGITLIESTLDLDQEAASRLVTECLKGVLPSKRIGITGVPGVGKSTFLEALGTRLCEKGEKVAVLAIDPSSEVSGGSILGDKTRMEKLSQHVNAFIRPSPSSGTIGGVGRRTLESIILCEAAGFNTVFVETVGVGQSETAVHHLTDVFVLLVLANAGDELQGIKRGIMEMADLVVINKSDGAQKELTAKAKATYHNALHLFPAKNNGWKAQVNDISSIEDRGIEKVWQNVEAFFAETVANGSHKDHRNAQRIYWMNRAVEDGLIHRFFSESNNAELRADLEKKVLKGVLNPFEAARKLIR